MNARMISDELLRRVPVLRKDMPVRAAVAEITEAQVPALPVVASDGTLCGIFGEREFIEALFPGYFGQLSSASFVPRSLDVEIERRAGCLDEEVGRYVNREHIHVRDTHSDAQLAETFLHHRVLIVPVVDGQLRVTGVVTRSDFFALLAHRALHGHGGG